VKNSITKQNGKKKIHPCAVFTIPGQSSQ